MNAEKVNLALLQGREPLRYQAPCLKCIRSDRSVCNHCLYSDTPPPTHTHTHTPPPPQPPKKKVLADTKGSGEAQACQVFPTDNSPGVLLLLLLFQRFRLCK